MRFSTVSQGREVVLGLCHFLELSGGKPEIMPEGHHGPDVILHEPSQDITIEVKSSINNVGCEKTLNLSAIRPYQYHVVVGFVVPRNHPKTWLVIPAHLVVFHIYTGSKRAIRRLDPYATMVWHVSPRFLEAFGCHETQLRARIIAAHEAAQVHPIRKVMSEYVDDMEALVNRYNQAVETCYSDDSWTKYLIDFVDRIPKNLDPEVLPILYPWDQPPQK